MERVGTYFHEIKLDFEEIGELCSVTINKLGRYMLLNVQGWHTAFFWNSRKSKITWNSGKREKILEPGKIKRVL